MTDKSKSAGSGEIEAGRAEIAGILGISEREVTNLVKAYPEFPSIVTGKSRRFPVARCVQWYVRFKAQEAIKRAKPATPTNVDEMHRRRAEADMKMAEMDIAEREGRLVSVDDIDRIVGEICDRMRAFIVNIPGNFGLRLEELGIDAAKAEAILSAIAEEMIAALRGVADEVEGLDAEESSDAAATDEPEDTAAD